MKFFDDEPDERVDTRYTERGYEHQRDEGAVATQFVQQMDGEGDTSDDNQSGLKNEEETAAITESCGYGFRVRIESDQGVQGVGGHGNHEQTPREIAVGVDGAGGVEAEIEGAADYRAQDGDAERAEDNEGFTHE